MSNIDLRYIILLAINNLKSQAASPWDWDPYQNTWPTYLAESLPSRPSLPSTSLNLNQTPPQYSIWYETYTVILLQFGAFNPQLTFALICSVLFPQALFWYVYPIIISVFVWSPLILNFLKWLQGVLTSIPVSNIIIRASSSQNLVPPQPEVEAQPEESVEIMELWKLYILIKLTKTSYI